MILGAGFLLLFTGTFAGLWMLKPGRLTEQGARCCARFTSAAAWAMTILALAAVFAGTYVVYPWYRAAPPRGTPAAALVGYPKYKLLSDPNTAAWHEFGMEWKEHIAWLVPMLTTAVAYCISRTGFRIVNQASVRRMLLILLSCSFFCAATAGVLGALINKAAPVK
jgi:hypothetical protein